MIWINLQPLDAQVLPVFHVQPQEGREKGGEVSLSPTANLFEGRCTSELETIAIKPEKNLSSFQMDVLCEPEKQHHCFPTQRKALERLQLLQGNLAKNRRK